MYSFIYMLSGTIKFHKVGHWPEWILEFGEPGNYNGETWETAHKWFVKRWIGKMALNGNGAISTLLRRNDVAEAHRRSTNFDDNSPRSKRRRVSSSLLGRLSDGCYSKFFSEMDDAWVGLGDTVAFGLNGDDSFRIGLVEKIFLNIDHVHVFMRLYIESPVSTTRPLSSYCKRRLLDTTGSLIEVNISADNMYLALFSVQPDFVDGGFFDCPFMDILK